jgi:hypothetical protein
VLSADAVKGIRSVQEYLFLELHNFVLCGPAFLKEKLNPTKNMFGLKL